MNRTICYLTLLLLIPSISFAALSPLNQSIVELKKILNSPEINDRLPQGEEIESVRHEGNHFIIQTKTASVNVEVRYQPTQHMGPRPFELIYR